MYVVYMWLHHLQKYKFGAQCYEMNALYLSLTWPYVSHNLKQENIKMSDISQNL